MRSRDGIRRAVDAVTEGLTHGLAQVEAIANDLPGVLDAGAAVRVPPARWPSIALVVLAVDLQNELFHIDDHHYAYWHNHSYWLSSIGYLLTFSANRWQPVGRMYGVLPTFKCFPIS